MPLWRSVASLKIEEAYGKRVSVGSENENGCLEVSLNWMESAGSISDDDAADCVAQWPKTMALLSGGCRDNRGRTD